MTSSPQPIPSAFSATSIVTVPFDMTMPCSAPWYAANRSANSAARGPGSGQPPIWPLRTTSATASTSRSVISGHAGNGSLRTAVAPRIARWLIGLLLPGRLTSDRPASYFLLPSVKFPYYTPLDGGDADRSPRYLRGGPAPAPARHQRAHDTRADPSFGDDLAGADRPPHRALEADGLARV